MIFWPGEFDLQRLSVILAHKRRFLAPLEIFVKGNIWSSFKTLGFINRAAQAIAKAKIQSQALAHLPAILNIPIVFLRRKLSDSRLSIDRLSIYIKDEVCSVLIDSAQQSGKR